MGIVEEMSEGLDCDAVHTKYGMSTEEEAVYAAKPTILSFYGRYLLVGMVFGIHMLWWAASGGGGPEADDQSGTLVSILDPLFSIVDLFGMLGFVVAMFGLLWANRFLNFSTSGRWYTVSLFVVTFTPLAFVLEDTIVWIADLLDKPMDGFLPSWSDGWYFWLGVVYSSVLLVLTIIFQRSFSYAISTRALYMRKDFVFDVVNKHREHRIPLSKIENRTLNRSLLGTIFGFGTINGLTGSGFGISSESTAVSVSTAADVAMASTAGVGLIRRFFRIFIIVLSAQRTRQDINDEEPQDCLFGIRKPVKVNKLLTELEESIRLVSRHEHEAEVPLNVPEPVTSEEESDDEIDALDELLDDM
jgi:hypothetical protein